jgi:hypothetical protein
LPEEAAQERAQRAAAVRVAQALLEPVQGEGADARLGLAVQVHADEVQLREGPGGAEVVGGPLVDLGSWVAEGAGHLRLTPQAAEGLEP